MCKFTKELLTFLLILCFSLLAQSQEDLTVTFDSIVNSDVSAGIKIEGLLKLLNTNSKLIPSEEKARIYHKLGLYYYSEKNYQKAIEATKESVLIQKSLDKTDLAKLNNSLYNVSFYYKEIGDLTLRIRNLKYILDTDGDDKFVLKAYLELAYIFTNEGDFFLALQYLDAINNSSFIAKDYSNKFLIHAAYIYIYSEMAVSRKFISKIELHAFETKKLSKYVSLAQKASVDTNLGKIYESLGDTKKCINYFNEALSFYVKNDTVYAGILYNNIAAVFSKNNDTINASINYTNALNITNNNLVQSYVYNNQGYYLQTNKSVKKIVFYQKALQLILEEKNNSESDDFLPSFEKIKNSSYKLDILSYLSDIAIAWVESYEEEKNATYLLEAKKTLYLIDELVSLIRFESTSENSKLFWISRGVNTYMLAVKVCYLLNDSDAAFFFMEKNKSLVLLENLNKKRYPAYFETKKAPKILSLKESIKTHVSKNTNLIEYILNESFGFGIFCTNEKVVFFEIKDIQLLNKEIKELKSQIAKPFIYSEDFKNFKKTSHAIFKKIFPFNNALSQITNKKLIVISDYELQTIPFEALIISSKSENLIESYLINHTEISYLQSTSVFQQINFKTNIGKNKMLGYAPVTYKNSLPDLKRSVFDMKQIITHFNGELRLKGKATKKSFLENLDKYEIIHLNTHAGIDSLTQDPWLAFRNEKLYLSELYSFENQANLVVLDACKSDTGVLKIGEGVMSLSRGFFFNGTKSVIASKWNANEKSSNEILLNFYKELSKGQTKSRSLHNAKLRYLNNHQLTETSPYFWASFTLTGNSESLQKHFQFGWLIYIISFIFCLVVAYIFYCRKHK